MNIVFDWAGTLADDQELTWRLTDGVIRDFGGTPIGFEEYRREFSLPAEGFYRKRCPDASWKEIDTAFSESCRRRYPAEAKLWPGIRAGLDCLPCKNRLFLMSTLDQATLEDALDRLGLRSRFETVMGSVADKTRALPEFLRSHDLSLDETVAVGDTPHDIRAARTAGVESIAVAYGYSSAGALAEAEPETLLTGVPELLRYLDKLASAQSRHFPVATVGGLIRDGAGNVLLIRTRKWSGLYGIPGGKVDYGETLESAFVREVREETGLQVRNVRFAMIQDCVEHPEFYRPRHFILVNYVCEVPGEKPAVRLNHESDRFVWAGPKEALGMSLNGPTRILIEKTLEVGRAVPPPGA